MAARESRQVLAQQANGDLDIRGDGCPAGQCGFAPCKPTLHSPCTTAQGGNWCTQTAPIPHGANKKDSRPVAVSPCRASSTGGGDRTLTPLRALDFESSASAIPPLRQMCRPSGDCKTLIVWHRAIIDKLCTSGVRPPPKRAGTRITESLSVESETGRSCTPTGWGTARNAACKHAG